MFSRNSAHNSCWWGLTVADCFLWAQTHPLLTPSLLLSGHMLVFCPLQGFLLPLHLLSRIETAICSYWGTGINYSVPAPVLREKCWEGFFMLGGSVRQGPAGGTFSYFRWSMLIFYHLLSPTSWDQAPYKLFTFKSLSQDLFLRKHRSE